MAVSMLHERGVFALSDPVQRYIRAGFYVVTDPVRAQIPTSPGEYGWGGLASTAFRVNPAEDLVVFLTQLVPSTTFDFRGQLKAIIHSAIVA